MQHRFCIRREFVMGICMGTTFSKFVVCFGCFACCFSLFFFWTELIRILGGQCWLTWAQRLRRQILQFVWSIFERSKCWRKKTEFRKLQIKNRLLMQWNGWIPKRRRFKWTKNNLLGFIDFLFTDRVDCFSISIVCQTERFVLSFEPQTNRRGQWSQLPQTLPRQSKFRQLLQLKERLSCCSSLQNIQE